VVEVEVVLDLSSNRMDNIPPERPWLAARIQIRQRLHQFIVLFLSIVVTATAAVVQSLEGREPYHTSILTGEGWVMELLGGHPDRIRCELGVSLDVYSDLISDLRAIGHVNSKHVSLEEQLAIFLYAVVTGLTVRHLGERFQRSNETISL
jgi:hypothetical protein